jgi:hypothetical protein
MAKEIVVIGCRLPHGIILHSPVDNTKTVAIKGLNSSELIVPYVLTPVDANFWTVWEMANKDFAPLKSKALFVAKNKADADAMGDEFKKERTGLETINPNTHGIKTVEKE